MVSERLKKLCCLYRALENVITIAEDVHTDVKPILAIENYYDDVWREIYKELEVYDCRLSMDEIRSIISELSVKGVLSENNLAMLISARTEVKQ